MDKISDAAPAAVSDDLRVPPSSGAARRLFLTSATQVAALGGAATLVGCGEGLVSPLANYGTPTPTPSGTATPTPTPTIQALTDVEMIVLMTQLHYLQAEFYSRAVFGQPLAAALVTGTGTLGTVTGGSLTPIADPLLAQQMREMAAEKIDQVVQLRAVLGTATPARPSIDISTNPGSAFAKYATDATPVTTPPTPPTIGDVYSNQDQLLLGAFLLEDAVITAWRGIATLLVSAANVDLAAGLLATSSVHTGFVRSQLLIRGGVAGSTLRNATVRLSDLRDSYSVVDDDRGVIAGNAADVDPADGDGQIYGRLPNFTLNVFYMTRASATSGGFFPSGVNGTLNQSTAN